MSFAFMPKAALSRTCSLLALATALSLGGCAVGPDFHRPAQPAVDSYDSSSTPAATADQAQSLHPADDIPGEWWQLFHSDDLTLLVDQALQDNPDLASAQASLRVAQDDLAAGSASLFPTVSASFSSQRQKVAGAAYGGVIPSLIYTLHNASVGVSYNLDLFGGTRRMIEGLEAQAEQSRFQTEATYLSLTSNVVTAAIQEASAREQIAATRSIIADQERVLKILQARFDAGAISRTTLAQQQASLATARANLPPLEHNLVVEQHALSDLTGLMPQQAPSVDFTLAGLTLPPDVPLSVPSQLVDQRPDIRMAEANLHAASAAIGVAIANRLPQITLSADIGTEATQIGKLLTPGGGFWAFGGSVAETLFDAGALSDREDAARDAYAAAVAEYKSTVLAAFEDVANALHALQADAETLNAITEADRAASQSLALAQAQLKAGSITPVEVLQVEQTEQQAKISLAQAKAQRFADTAALLAALGGGWWNRQDIPPDQTTIPEKILKGVQ